MYLECWILNENVQETYFLTLQLYIDMAKEIVKKTKTIFSNFYKNLNLKL